MSRQIKMISIMFAVLTLIIISELHLRLKKDDLSSTSVKRFRVGVASLITLVLISSFYFLTDSLKDFFIVAGSFAFLIGYFFVLIKEPDIGENPLLALNFSIWVIWFFIRNLINRHLLIPINYSIIIIFIVNLIQINSKKDRNTASKYYLANALGIIVLLLLIFFMNDSYRGISKQEYIARDYMMEKYSISRDDIKEIGRVEAIDNGERVFVEIKSSNTIYLLKYKAGEIVGVDELKK